MEKPSPAGATGPALALAALLGLGLVIFAGVLFQDRQFAYRDAGYFYYPLHQRVQEEWQAGRWPLWAPEWNAGTPLLGNPSTAVLYPGKLVFALLRYPWAARVYVLLHVVLAFATLRALLRSWDVSRTGATLGALAYAFGTPVLSQTCNVIFLVGASWAPLAFLAADGWLRRQRRGGLVGLAVVLALQVLGGDPQAAYTTLICASAYAAGLAAVGMSRRAWLVLGAAVVPLYAGLLALTRASTRAWASHGSIGRPPVEAIVLGAWAVGGVILLGRARGRGTRGFAPRLAGLAGAALVAVAVAGVQFLPALEFVRVSSRMAEGDAVRDVYPYSVHPLHVLGAVWPNVYGSVGPTNRVWGGVLPPTPDPLIWVPSLYVGGLTLVLALAGFSLRSGPPWRVWLSCVAVLTLLAAFGAYGSPLLWARFVPGWSTVLGPPETRMNVVFRSDGYLRDGDGGLYWLLASAFPFFQSFRYPAKFLVFTAMAVCALAGVGWDRLVAERSRRARWTEGALLALSLVALGGSWVAGGPLRAWLTTRAPGAATLYGPFDVAGALAELRGGLAHGAVIFALVGVLARVAPRYPASAGALAVVLMALDLGLAGARQLQTVPQADFEGTPRILKAIQQAEQGDPSPGPFRVQRVGTWWPDGWFLEGSPRRTAQLVRWERDTLRPLYGLPLKVEPAFYPGTIELYDYQDFSAPWEVNVPLAFALDVGLKPGATVRYYPRRGFDLWGTRYFIVPSTLVWDTPARGFGSLVPQTRRVYPPPDAFDGPEGDARRERWVRDDDVQVLRNEAAYPRAWIVHQARVVPPVGKGDAERRQKLMRELLYQADSFWRNPVWPVHDPHRVAWVETDHPEEVNRLLSKAEPDPSETVNITDRDPQRVELTASLRSPGIVVVSDVYYPGWTVTVDGRPAEILRTNRAMRGVALPSGTHHLVFRYQPASVRAGVVLSALGVLALTALGGWARAGREPRAA